ncbi:hypothetical protein GCM10012280_23330 [Wenjunlia tyrosinilytica]|uniref:Uncharacterized protein n=1 Tax=Wenjunlia tyrosinilytica TaxID=1544741 RepID=A0A917ZNS9_9ACTN|nr:hypothetical protein GCM10012280_23330 [Wenjunlia tyrosinilytica]
MRWESPEAEGLRRRRQARRRRRVLLRRRVLRRRVLLSARMRAPGGRHGKGREAGESMRDR